jgi:hypothetical protein
MRHTRNIAVFFVLVLTRCTSSDEAKSKYPDSASYCRARAEAECTDAVVSSCAISSKDACAAQRQLVCQASLPAGKVYDNAKAEACINAVAAAYADAQLTKDEIQAHTAACGLLFNGAGSKGATCSANLDCKQSEGLACVVHTSVPTGGADAALGDAGPTSGAVVGSCQVPQLVQGGESCSAPEAKCVDEFHCGTTQHCDANGANGERCDASLPCKSAFKCSAAGTCEPRLADGVGCGTDGDCASGICLEGVNLCAARVVLAPNEPFCRAAAGRD